MTAKKFDSGKLRMELLSVPALRGLSDVLTFGAQKYDSHNWRSDGGLEWSRLYGASLRHLLAHMNGEDTDEETGLSHLDHALCCIMFLSEYEKTANGKDDRFIPTETIDSIRNIAKGLEEAEKIYDLGKKERVNFDPMSGVRYDPTDGRPMLVGRGRPEEEG